MSGTQTTLTDRTPNILNKDPPDKKPKNDKSPVSLKHEFDPTGLVPRCVIIQRDKNGFGLTVSGDNPVFVQLVKKDGAAMRAGVQTGDRIIKVNGTLVTHSNHIEVVKLIKSGSYVALTVLGRPPGLPQIPLGVEEEQEEEEEEGGGEVSLSSPLSAPHSPALSGGEQGCPFTSSTSCSPQDHSTPPLSHGDENSTVYSQKADTLQKRLTMEQQDLQAKEEEHGRNPRPQLLKEIQEAKRRIAQLQDQLSKTTGAPQDSAPGSREGEDEEGDSGLPPREQAASSRLDSSSDRPSTNTNSMPSSPPLESAGQKETPCQSPKISTQDGLNFCPSPDTEDSTDLDSSAQCIVGGPPCHLNPQIIGAEDDYFDTQQEQINGQCSCFQSMELLKSRPAHLAAFLHHVVSQFDPAPLLCYLYADLHKQTSSKESRRLFIDFHSLFMDRAANLKVPVPESIATELERRRLELIPEELCKQYTQVLQDALLPDLHRNLEDFRQKRSMGLTLAEEELSKLDSEKGKDQMASERECSCAEHIISKIEDILLTSQPTEEEKCATMQYVILTYMKHLGVKVKEPRSLEPKRARINFLPKIKKSIKPEKEGEEKVKKPRFPNILGQPRRPSRGDSMSFGKQRSPRQLSQPALSIPEHPDSSGSGRIRGSQSSDGSDASTHFSPSTASPPHSATCGQASDTGGQDSDSSFTPSSAPPRPSEGPQSTDHQDGVASPAGTQFDFSPSTLDQLQEEDQEPCSRMDGQNAVSSADVQSEDDQGTEVECEEDPLNWQRLVSRGVLASLTPQEIKRQEVINELLYTERAHLRMLRVLDCVFYQRLNRDGVLPPEDIKHIFTNLEEIIQLHVSITEQMTAVRKRSETSVIGQIGDDLLAWFSGEEEEKIKRAAGTFCSNQPSALELIKTRQKKDQRFTSFMQEAESNRLCRRLQLKDIIPVEMQRLTKYPLLLESIAKYTEDAEEREKVRKAGGCCRKIVNHVNQAVKEAENRQRLVEYQRRLDLSSLKQSENPMIWEFKNLDLTKRKMVHEGPLSWKVNKDKTIELYTILLEDILVLLQKQDERLVLKCHSKNLAGTAETKHIFSPIIKLNTVLVRSVATDNKSFFVLSMSDNGAQIYELMAQTVSDQKTWQCLITQCADAMKKAKPHNDVIPLVQTDAERDAIEIINPGMTKLSKDSHCTSSGSVPSPDKDPACSPGLPAPPSLNPFEGIKSEDEEEESALADRREPEEEEVDEEELEAFLDGQLADRLPFLQERSRQGIAIENQENPFDLPSFRAEEALRTLAMLKQLLLNHMISREEEEKEETEERKQRKSGAPGCLLRASSCGSSEGPSAVFEESRAPERTLEKNDPVLPPGHIGLFEPTESDGNFVVLDFGGGSEESSTDDDGGGGGDVGIDMKKLLSSSSQTGDGGPNLNRQLMTHLRLLQASLQHLKEVEMKYNQLRQTLSDTATDSDESNDRIQ